MPAAFPLIAGLVLSAAGTGAGIAATDSTRRSMNKASDAEAQRQQKYSKEGSKTALAAVAQNTPRNIDAYRKEGEDRYNAAAGEAAKRSIAGSFAPTAGTEEAARVTAGVQNTAAGRAGMAGYSESDLAQRIKNLQTMSHLGLTNQFANTSAGILPYSLQGAQQAGAGTAAIGTGLQAAGMLASLYGAYSQMPSAAPGGIQRSVPPSYSPPGYFTQPVV